MPLDPGLAALLDTMARMNMTGLSKGTPQEARAAFRLVSVDARPPDFVIAVGEVENREIPGPAGPLAIRVYRPEPNPAPELASGPASEPASEKDPDQATGAGAELDPAPDATPDGRPTLLFVHGGGWVIGDLDTHDNQARRLCRDVGAVVVSVDYRLAPEHPWPAAVEDCWAALAWVADHVADLGGDAGRIAVAGDSAGGNLAAVLARRSRDAGAPALAAQLLIYPGIDLSTQDPALYPSRAQNAEGKLLTGADIVWFSSAYLGIGPDGALPEGLDPAHPDVSPLKAADLSGLPPAVVVTAEFDPLRDEGEAYAWALQEAGTEVVLARMDGMIHGFFDLGPASPAVEAAVALTTALLRDLLEPT
jgi:acetyl esterase